MYAFIIPWIVMVLGSSSPIVVNLTNQQIKTAYLIYHHAVENDISPEKFLKLAVCESGLNQIAVGDKGKAFGLYQWHESSWNLYTKSYNEFLEYTDPIDQIYLSAKVLGDGGWKNWYTCGKKLALK